MDISVHKKCSHCLKGKFTSLSMFFSNVFSIKMAAILKVNFVPFLNKVIQWA